MNEDYLQKRIRQLEKENDKLKRKLKEVKEDLLEAEDSCDRCGSHKWSRPGLPEPNGNDWSDYTKRRCSNCGHIRPDPSEDD